MQNIDADAFARLLTETAECYGQKPLTAGAQRRWFEILKDFPFDSVSAAMRGWLKYHARMPVPNSILEMLQDRGRKAPETFATEPPTEPPTERSKRTREALLLFLAGPKPSSNWADEILQAHAAGEPLKYRDIDGQWHWRTEEKISALQLRCATEAVKNDRRPARIPGEDDE